MREQWRWHWGEWAADATVLLNDTAVLRGELDAVQSLRAIPEGTIAALRRTIARNAHRMQYSAGDTIAQRAALGPAAEDAFDVALAGAWQRALGSGQQEARGRRRRGR